MNEFMKVKKSKKLDAEFEDILSRYALACGDKTRAEVAPSNEEIQFAGDYNIHAIAIRHPELAEFYMEYFDTELYYF